ncbi:MAG: hypothetical protein NTY19_14495 [Planctomycetota bacterium]|nr:hypothetical protein [Planctomycetota bacterium]
MPKYEGSSEAYEIPARVIDMRRRLPGLQDKTATLEALVNQIGTNVLKGVGQQLALTSVVVVDTLPDVFDRLRIFAFLPPNRE